MSLEVGQRVCVTQSESAGIQLWATVHHIGPSPDEDRVVVDIVFDDGRYGHVLMPGSAVDDPWVPAPIRDPEALEQWLAR